MIVLLLSFLAAATAAPHYHHHHGFHHHPPPPPHSDFGLMDPFFSGDVFDTKSFWEDLSREMKQLDEVLQEFTKHFPSVQNTAGVDGNEYKIKIFLDGYDESEIKVKANEGVLMIQATHSSQNGGIQRNYLDLRTLPDNVSPRGNWSYEGGVLTVVLPLKNTETTTEVTTEAGATDVFTTASQIEHSREQMGSKEDADDKMDADVGLGNRGDNEILTNEISGSNTVEATTYAVDLKGEVEFVPVRY